MFKDLEKEKQITSLSGSIRNTSWPPERPRKVSLLAGAQGSLLLIFKSFGADSYDELELDTLGDRKTACSS
jgi:hypothetical protein